MRLLGKAQDTDFWMSVREKDYFSPYVSKIKNEYDERMKKGALTALKYSEFKLYFTTGNRSVYEGNYFDRRSLMENSALLCLIYPEEQEYLDTLMDVIYAICDEYTWCLPAHQGCLEQNNNCRIDLFAAETGYALAQIYTLLSDRLEPLILNRIRAEIDRRIVHPFTDVDFYGWWENDRLNWTGVCMGSVSCTLMLMRPELVTEKYLERLNKSFECFLSGFDSDGICYEGAGYWHYGFGFFIQCAEMVRRFTEGAVDYFKSEKVKRVATYHQKMFLSGNSSVSFADAGAFVTQPTYLIHFLKSEYPDDILVFAPQYGNDGSGEFSYHYRFFSWFNEEAYLSNADNSAGFEFFAPEAQWMIKKTASYGFAAKGGDNEEFHNHNDAGSFIFAKNGRHILTDLGGGVYSRQYFAVDTRYTYLECRSAGHSVPLINGEEQRFGKIYAAKDAEYKNGTFSIDISGAYGIPELTSLKRSFTFGEESVTITDEINYSGSGSITERLISLIEPKSRKKGKLEIGECTISYGDNISAPKISTDRSSGGRLVYLIDFDLKVGERIFTCTIE